MELELLLAQTQAACDELQQCLHVAEQHASENHDELLGCIAENEQLVAAVGALECKAEESEQQIARTNAMLIELGSAAEAEEKRTACR